MQLDVLTYKHEDYEVIVRTTDDISYSWTRFKNRVRADESVSAKTYCAYTSSDSCELTLYDIQENKSVLYSSSNRWENLWPVIFETNTYQISVKFSSAVKDFKVIHIRKDVEACFYQEEQRLVGNVNFLNNPGVFRLELEYVKDGRRLNSWVTFEVVSPKLDTKRDYKSILRAVNDEYEDVIYRYLSTTYQQFAKGKKRNDFTWMQAFQTVVDDYLRNVKRIVQNPNYKIRTYQESRKADQIKRWSPPMEEEYEEARAENRHEEKYFTYDEYEKTVNTLENRFVKYSVSIIGKRLVTILDKVLKDSNVSDNYRNEWANYRDLFVKLQKHPLFKRVGRFEGLTQESLVLQNRMGYQQIYRDWLKLRRGIDLYDGATNIGTLQIWEIYELWCFVKMKHLVRDVMGINKDNPDYEKLVVEPKGSLLNPFTDSTLEHIVEYHYPSTASGHDGDVVTLHYQHTFNRTENKDGLYIRTATTEQRPDIVLNIRKSNGDVVLTYLYDAKYRVVDDKKLDKDFEKADVEEHERLGGDYPPSDAINQMHRYRDAIYYGAKQGDYESKEIIGGYILFPGRGDDNTLSQRYFSKSIESVNIGAFPLLPNEDESKEGELLKIHLKKILLDKQTPFAHVENAIPQRGRSYKANEKMLVALTSSEDKYQWCIKNGKYPIPIEKANKIEGLMKVEHLLLHYGNTAVLLKLNIGKVEVKSKEDMSNLDYPSPNNSFYLLLHTEDGYRYPSSIDLNGYVRDLGSKNKVGLFIEEYAFGL